MTSSLVSVIMPVYNAELYIAEAINSVLNQTHTNWELLIINDGSTDNSEKLIKNFTDQRIIYNKQENKGVSAARNVGLKNMKGDYFCFLDADDLMTPQSISSRIKVFNRKDNLIAVSGSRQEVSHDLKKKIILHVPEIMDDSSRRIALLDSRAFFGCVVYLIRNTIDYNISFQNKWTHCEDLAFCFEINQLGQIGITQDTIQIYRRHNESTMNNLNGLANGYYNFYKYIKKSGFLNGKDMLILKYRVLKVSTLSLLDGKKLRLAIYWAWKNLVS